MSYEVCPGQTLIHNGTRYPSGSIAPADLPNISELTSLGVVQVVEDTQPARPKPVPRVVEVAPHGGFDVSDPETVKLVPLRHLTDCLSTVDDIETLRQMHEAETRKGGLDRIEERIGELETS